MQTEPIILLVFSILALAVGPAIYSLVRRKNIMLSLLDGFIFVAISGLVLLCILPECFDSGGWATFIFLGLGFFGPSLLEHLFHRSARETHIVTLILGLIGLGLHAAIDGSTLTLNHAASESASHPYLPLAVILHRLPVGLTIWWLLRPVMGTRATAAVLATIAVATGIGFSMGSLLLERLSTLGIAWFQAFVAGSLMHVVFHQPHLKGEDCGCCQVTPSDNHWEGAGALIGIALMVLLVSDSIAHSGSSHLAAGFRTFRTLALESAPALLFAYLAAGLMNAFLPRSSINWMRKGPAWSQALRGMAVGLPIPICSCGVVPLYRTLIKRGAPAAAAMAFLVSTPELGLDAVFLSIPLLGLEMTGIRVAAAALVAFLVGRLVGKYVSAAAVTDPTSEFLAEQRAGFPTRLKKGLQVGFGELVDHTAPWIVLGVAIAAVIGSLIQPDLIAGISGGFDVILFALLGLPVYVCASGATPLVAVLLFNGISPGAALAFLLTGPATNITTFGVLAHLHGRKTALSFSLVIIGLSIGLGYLVNGLFSSFEPIALDRLHAEAGTPFRTISLAILTVVYLGSVLRRGARGFAAEVIFQDARPIDLHPHYHS